MEILNIKKVISIIILIIVLAFSVLIFFLLGGPLILGEQLERERKDELSFSFSSCKGDSEYLNDQILSYQIEENTLFVKAAVTPNCGTTWIFGDYSINGQNIDLLYKTVLVSAMACICAHELEYEIEGLSEKDYKITIKHQEELYGDPSWFYSIFN